MALGLLEGVFVWKNRLGMIRLIVERVRHRDTILVYAMAHAVCSVTLYVHRVYNVVLYK